MTRAPLARAGLVAALAAGMVATTAAGTAPAVEAPTTAAPLVAQSDAGTPDTILLMDTSGSMGAATGSGSTRIQVAMDAAADLIVDWPGNAYFSVMTYSGGCEGNIRVRVPLGPLDVGASLSAVRRLQPKGYTPTGPALQNAAEHLTDAGGVIVLVSDGESQCSPEPCEVARELAREGVFVVNTIGFQLAGGAGEDELICIAEATGGVYRPVDDADDLARVIREVSLAPVTLQMQVPEVMLASAGTGPNATTTVTGTVRNAGTTTAPDVRVSFRFTQGAGGPVSATPPVRYLGNLGPGQEVPVTFNIRAEPAAAGVVTWQALLSTEATVVQELSGELEVLLGLSTASLGGPLKGVERVAVLGDSYSSGEGVGHYLEGTYDTGGSWCHKSMDTYAAQIFGAEATDLIACSGAVTGDLTGFQPSGPPDRKEFQDPQLMTLRQATLGPTPPQAVFLTIGGNDIGFADFVKTCMFHTGCDQGGPAGRFPFIRARALRPDLTTTYQQVHTVVNSPQAVAARGGQIAPIIVLPYVRIMPRSLAGYTPDSGCLILFSSEEVEVSNRLVDTLNASISTAVEFARIRDGVPVYYVGQDVIDAFQPRNTICDGDDSRAATVQAGLGALDRLPQERQQELAHPNGDGHAALARAIARWSIATDLPDPQTFQPATTQAAAEPAEARSTVLEVLTTPAQAAGVLVPGGPVTIQGSGFTPQAQVVHWIESSPRSLGSSTAGDDGRVEVTMTLPADLPPGEHTVYSMGLAEDGMHVEAVPVTVHRPGADLAWTALVAGAVLMLLGAAGWGTGSARARWSRRPRG